MLRPWTAALLLAALPLGAQTAVIETPSDPIARGDAAWLRRAEGARGAVAAEAPVNEALAAYEAALAEDETDLEARWKLMRGLYFHGEHNPLDDAARLATFERGRNLGEAGLDLLAAAVGGRETMDKMEPEELAAALGDRPGVAPLYFWNTVHWGLWGRTRGKLAAARQGVAARVRDGAEATIALDPLYEQAGGHRILGRLHDEAPKLPFVTGWIDRDIAVEQLGRAVELAPEDKLNRLYFAEALWQHRKDRRDEAIAMLRRLVEEPPQVLFPVEDAKALDEARALLERID